MTPLGVVLGEMSVHSLLPLLTSPLADHQYCGRCESNDRRGHGGGRGRCQHGVWNDQYCNRCEGNDRRMEHAMNRDLRRVREEPLRLARPVVRHHERAEQVQHLRAGTKGSSPEHSPSRERQSARGRSDTPGILAYRPGRHPTTALGTRNASHTALKRTEAARGSPSAHLTISLATGELSWGALLEHTMRAYERDKLLKAWAHPHPNTNQPTPTLPLTP